MFKQKILWPNVQNYVFGLRIRVQLNFLKYDTNYEYLEDLLHIFPTLLLEKWQRYCRISSEFWIRIFKKSFVLHANRSNMSWQGGKLLKNTSVLGPPWRQPDKLFSRFFMYILWWARRKRTLLYWLCMKKVLLPPCPSLETILLKPRQDEAWSYFEGSKGWGITSFKGSIRTFLKVTVGCP
jgi:hypothetical protein